MTQIDERHLIKRETTLWLRGIAVILVVLAHYAEWWTWFRTPQGMEEVLVVAFRKLDIYGMDVFFLLFGYAMVKSMKRERMYPEYIVKKIRNLYLPYFIVMGIIELLSGGFDSWQDFFMFASGYDHWYIFILFLMQTGFIAIYTIVGGSGPRVVVFAGFVALICDLLYERGMQSFWFMSNIAFVVGVAAAEYELQLAKVVKRAGRQLAVFLGLMFIPAIWAGVVDWGEQMKLPAEQRLWLQVGASLIWTLFILVLVTIWNPGGRWLGFLGKRSLYIYLTHTYIFMRCVNNLNIALPLQYVAAVILTVAVSWLLNKAMFKMAERLTMEESK